MGTKLLWFGLTVIETGFVPRIVGVVLMIVGLVLLLLNK